VRKWTPSPAERTTGALEGQGRARARAQLIGRVGHQGEVAGFFSIPVRKSSKYTGTMVVFERKGGVGGWREKRAQ